MRSSVILASFCAALSVASPIHKAVQKKDYVYDIVTDIVYVTITEGYPPPSSTPAVTTVVVPSTVVVVPTEEAPTTTSSSTPPPPPPPAPTTSTSTPAPAPEPAATSTTTPAPAPAATTSAAPVVQAAAVEVAATTTAAAAASAASPTDYDGVGLWHHNMHRANHTAGDLTWSDTLATYSLATANTCVFAHDMTEGGGGYGQNLAAYGSSDLSSVTIEQALADAITNQWYYGEEPLFPFGVASPSLTGPEFLHFSALVWKASTTVGCATVQCAAGTIFSDVPSLYTVCDYESEGNILGEFNTQVTEPIGNPAITAVI